MKKMLHKLYDFGGYSLYLQKMGILDCGRNLGSQGQSVAVAAILQTLPLPKLIMIAVCVLCLFILRRQSTPVPMF